MGIKNFFAKAFNLQGGSNPNGVPRGSSDSWTPPSWYPWDWWQKDMSTDSIVTNTTVEACVSTISETVAMLPIRHLRLNPNTNGYDEVRNSAIFRVMRRPNPFQTKSEFIVDLIRQCLLTGNGYGVCTRNKRFEIDAIYPQLKMHPFVSYDNKDVYYSMGDNNLIETLETMIPSRNVLHFKLHTVDHPLIGVTPLEAAVLSGSTANSIQGHTNRFFQNMSRPSGVLSTDMSLTPEQTKQLRDRFNDLSKDLNTGGTPILTNGLKYQSISMSAVDAEMIETYNMTVLDIVRVFRIPPALIGVMDKATFANTESLMQFWISTGLGFIVEHLENLFEDLFDLPPDEKIEFDTDVLLQTDFKGRMEGLKTAVQGGVLSINEAREKEGLGSIGKIGDIPMVQMQMVPVNLSAELAQSNIDSKLKTQVDENAKKFDDWLVEKRLRLKDLK